VATKKEEKEFEKERKAAIKARYKKMKEDGLEKYLTPEQIRYKQKKKSDRNGLAVLQIPHPVWSVLRNPLSTDIHAFNCVQTK